MHAEVCWQSKSYTFPQFCGGGQLSWIWSCGQGAETQLRTSAAFSHPNHFPESPWFSCKIAEIVTAYKKQNEKILQRSAGDNELNLDQVNQILKELFTFPDLK